MKKAIVAVVLILTSVVIFYFITKQEKEEITVTVTADTETMFDMAQNGATVRGLTTPYETKFRTDDANFIFKPRDSNANLIITAESKTGKILAKDGRIMVLVIDGRKWSTFGMD